MIEFRKFIKPVLVSTVKEVEILKVPDTILNRHMKEYNLRIIFFRKEILSMIKTILLIKRNLYMVLYSEINLTIDGFESEKDFK